MSTIIPLLNSPREILICNAATQFEGTTSIERHETPPPSGAGPDRTGDLPLSGGIPAYILVFQLVDWQAP